MSLRFKIGEIEVGEDTDPLVVPDIGINHGGKINRALKMIDDCAKAEAKIVKFQMHMPEHEMSYHAKKIIPGNAKVSIWDVISESTLTVKEMQTCKRHAEKLGLEFLCTPFSREAAEALNTMGVSGFKIGSGECNNMPLIEYIAKLRKPIILSTGMNDITSIQQAVNVMQKEGCKYAILHCSSVYPTDAKLVRLGGITALKRKFNCVVGISDHSLWNYACLGAIPYGASILEKHFTSSMRWKGPDIPISMDPKGLADMIKGSKFIHEAMGGTVGILQEQKHTIRFAYASVVAIKNIKKGERLSEDNIWVKRPGTGQYLAKDYNKLLGKKVKNDIRRDEQIKKSDIE